MKGWGQIFLFVGLIQIAWSQPANNNCGTATTITVGATCATTSGTVNNATASTPPIAPCTGNADDDVWFKFTAGSSPYTNLALSNFSSSGADMNFAVYTGTCASLTNVFCSDPNSGSLATTNGQTYYVRVYSNQAGNLNNTFDICATAVATPCGTPETNDYCVAPALMTAGGGNFSSSTYGNYTPDLPANLNTTFCTTNSSITVENNSWYTFVASGNSATFNFNVSNCSSGWGIQAQVLQVTHDVNGCCTGFTSVSDCEDGSGTGSFTLTANSLTSGQSYVLMVDGYEGDHCDFTISNWSATGILGVQLTKFYAIGFPDGNRVYWHTKSETESNYFELLRSFDGENFEVIAKLWGAGTSNYEHDYEYLDKNIRNGVCYYKLRQVDFNGKEQFAGPVQLNRTAQGNGILTLYPNPAHDKIFVEYNSERKNTNETVNIELLSVDGKAIQHEEITDAGFHQLQFDLSNLESGMYFIRSTTTGNSSVSVKRFIKE